MEVSVIIPMYNEEENVLHTLQEVKNVLRQYSPYQIIAVDDGSADNTLSLLEQYASENQEVEVLKHPMNLGMGKALVTGFKNAKGKVIVTLDAI